MTADERRDPQAEFDADERFAVKLADHDYAKQAAISWRRKALALKRENVALTALERPSLRAELDFLSARLAEYEVLSPYQRKEYLARAIDVAAEALSTPQIVELEGSGHD